VIGWKDKASILADQLAASEYLSDSQWHAAFRAIPRHLFVPRFWHDPATLLDGENPATRAAWLQAVYSDESLTTQYAPVPDTDLMWATSSSTQPSLMARMLERLNVHTGHIVLEIGTGTGYNAALLCYRLGDTHVTSIDIDPDLVADARSRLATLSYHPTLFAGDGASGAVDNAPYHRIIATCAVPAIPPAWIDQLTLSGTIVVDLRGDLASKVAPAASGPSSKALRHYGMTSAGRPATASASPSPPQPTIIGLIIPATRSAVSLCRKSSSAEGTDSQGPGEKPLGGGIIDAESRERCAHPGRGPAVGDGVAHQQQVDAADPAEQTAVGQNAALVGDNPVAAIHPDPLDAGHPPQPAPGITWTPLGVGRYRRPGFRTGDYSELGEVAGPHTLDEAAVVIRGER